MPETLLAPGLSGQSGMLWVVLRPMVFIRKNRRLRRSQSTRTME